MESIIAAALEKHVPRWQTPMGCTCGALADRSLNWHAAHQARAALAAISEAGAVEWGVSGPNGYVNYTQEEADARLQVATRNGQTLYRRIAATEWEVAE